MNNPTANLTSRQQKSNETYYLSSIPQEFIDFPLKLLKKLHWTDKEILNNLFYYDQFGHIAVSQQTIARRVNLTRQSVNRKLQRLRNMGLIGWVNRFSNTNIYTISNFWRDPTIQKILTSYLPGLYHVKLNYNQEIIINNNYQTVIVTLVKLVNLRSNSSLVIPERDSVHSLVSEDIRRLNSRKRRSKKPLLEISVRKRIRKREEMNFSWGIFNFSQLQLDSFALFNTTSLSKAYDIYKKQRNVIDPYRYFLELCKRLNASKRLPPQAYQKKEPMENSYLAFLPDETKELLCLQAIQDPSILQKDPELATVLKAYLKERGLKRYGPLQPSGYTSNNYPNGINFNAEERKEER